jgi:hypothetical protein
VLEGKNATKMQQKYVSIIGKVQFYNRKNPKRLLGVFFQSRFNIIQQGEKG